MTLHLALDTATDRPSLALGTGADAVERILAHRHDLSREIDGAVRELMGARRFTPAKLGGVIVSDGPGSFTGLRIGIAFAKGLCRALGIPLLAAPSMLGAAHHAARGDGLVAVRYDALRGQVYRAIYRFGVTALEIVEAPALVAADAPLPAGSIAADAQHASARALLRLAGVDGALATIADPQSWEPSYGRPAEAEARLRARHAG